MRSWDQVWVNRGTVIQKLGVRWRSSKFIEILLLGFRSSVFER